MLEMSNVYRLFEIFAVIVCLYRLHGKKISADIKTVGFVTIEITFMHLLQNGIITDKVYFVIYVLYIIYTYIEFGNKMRNTVFACFLAMVIVGVIQMLISVPVYAIGNTQKMSEEVIAIIINFLLLLSVLLISRVVRFSSICDFFLRKEWVLNICSILVMIIVFYGMYLIKYSEKIDTDLYVIIITFILIVGCVLIRWYKFERMAQEKQLQIELASKYSKEYEELVKVSRMKQHDFNNQISALYGMNIIKGEGNKEQKEYMDTIMENSKTIKILNYVEQPVLAGYLYRKVTEILDEGINVEYELSVPNCTLPIDVFDCIEILGVLLDNAVEAIKISGVEKEIAVRLFVADAGINISVKNVSKNFDNDEIAKFFEKGYTTKDSGRGVGLAKLKELQKKYNFDIFVEMQEVHEKDWLAFSIIKNLR